MFKRRPRAQGPGSGPRAPSPGLRAPSPGPRAPAPGRGPRPRAPGPLPRPSLWRGLIGRASGAGSGYATGGPVERMEELLRGSDGRRAEEEAEMDAVFPCLKMIAAGAGARGARGPGAGAVPRAPGPGPRAQHSPQRALNEPFCCILGPLGGFLGPFLGLLRHCWGLLGPSWGLLGPWGRLGANPAPSQDGWENLGPS